MKAITKVLSLAGLAAAALLFSSCACASKAHCASCATDKAAAAKACPVCGKAGCASCAPAKVKAKKM